MARQGCILPCGCWSDAKDDWWLGALTDAGLYAPGTNSDVDHGGFLALSELKKPKYFGLLVSDQENNICMILSSTLIPWFPTWSFHHVEKMEAKKQSYDQCDCESS